MKKFILTGCAAALISIGTMAQVQDTASINNNLRQGAQETEENVDKAGNEVQDSVERTGNEIQQETEKAGDQIQQGAERTGEQIEQGAERTGNEIQQGAEKADDQIQQGAERTGEQIEKSTDPATDKPDQPAAQGQEGNVTGTENSVSSTNAAPPTEIEVMEDKEGPNNQVVYKYQGSLFYVDKEEKKLVKIEESQLKDAEHKAIISDNNN